MRLANLAVAAGLLAPGAASAAEPFKRPDIMRWGATSAQVQAALAGKCAKGFKQRPINPPFLPRVKTAQVQIDCDGFEFMGAPRWTEFVIGDDRLQMVWIMVRPGDQDAIVAAMTAAYGPATKQNDAYIAFPERRAAWRHKPAEVLFYAPELDAWAGAWFEPGAK